MTIEQQIEIAELEMNLYDAERLVSKVGADAFWEGVITDTKQQIQNLRQKYGHEEK